MLTLFLYLLLYFQEEASMPGLTLDEIRQKLTFVIVGGGPTGVEFAGELSDFILQDCPKEFPEVKFFPKKF